MVGFRFCLGVLLLLWKCHLVRAAQPLESACFLCHQNQKRFSANFNSVTKTTLNARTLSLRLIRLDSQKLSWCWFLNLIWKSLSKAYGDTKPRLRKAFKGFMFWKTASLGFPVPLPYKNNSCALWIMIYDVVKNKLRLNKITIKASTLDLIHAYRMNKNLLNDWLDSNTLTLRINGVMTIYLWTLNQAISPISTGFRWAVIMAP